MPQIYIYISHNKNKQSSRFVWRTAVAETLWTLGVWEGSQCREYTIREPGKRSKGATTQDEVPISSPASEGKGTRQEGTVQGGFPQSSLILCLQTGSDYWSRCPFPAVALLTSCHPGRFPPPPPHRPAFLGSPELLVILERAFLRGTAESRDERRERMF